MVAYQSYWSMVLRVNDPPNPADPEIPQRTTGDRLAALITLIQQNAMEGKSYRLPPDAKYEHDARVVSVAGDRAVVSDCNVDDGLIVNTATGEVVDAQVVTLSIEARLTRENGLWKVVSIDITDQQQGVAACAGSSS